MCGIAGLVAAGSRAALKREIGQMIEMQAHRGPDGEGVVVIGSPGPWPVAVLGNRRLAVIDLSAAGHQPMAAGNGKVWITFNGEIYNFAALRAELITAGHRFRSSTDTEVVLRGYLQWGIERLLKRLRGMFAFAIWDARTQRMLVARDRLGEKPVYYAAANRRLVFASELKAILTCGLVDCELSAAGIYAFLAIGSVPAPLSILDPVKALEPGCYLEFADGEATVRRYWEARAAEVSSLSYTQTVERLHELLAESVRIRMVSDVPIGVFLSGGLDSTAILAFMREASSQPLRAHSIAFPQEGINEVAYARIAAHRFSADLVEHEVTAAAMADHLPRLMAAIDQPSIDGVNSYFVSMFARNAGTVVALSGLGGDELFGGYNSFRRVPALRHTGSAARIVPGANWLVDKLLASSDQNMRGDRLRAFFRREPSLASAYMAVRGLFLEGEIAALLDPEIATAAHQKFDPLRYFEGLAPAKSDDSANAVSLLELRAYMQNQLLRDTDVMSMAHSLEVRCPLVDHELVEFVLSIRPEWKFRGRPKSMLVRALGGVIPEEIVRRPKAGFNFPLEEWFKTTWLNMLPDILGAAGSGTIIDCSGALKLWQGFLKDRVHWSRIWALVVLKLWLIEFARIKAVRRHRVEPMPRDMRVM